MSGPVLARLPDGRLHLQHGPIDLVIEGFGAKEEVEAAYGQAWGRFQGILQTLVDELSVLPRDGDTTYANAAKRLPVPKVIQNKDLPGLRADWLRQMLVSEGMMDRIEILERLPAQGQERSADMPIPFILAQLRAK